MTIIEKYTDEISGVLNCYDRINIKCVAGQWGYAGGMTQFFYEQNRLCFDYAKVFEPVTKRIVANTEKIAEENGTTVEFIRSPKNFGRKEDKIDVLLEQRGNEDGLVKIYSQMEIINSYKAWTDKSTGKTSFINDSRKCLVYYFYVIDKYLGLCFVKVPTAAPFICTVYFNGHNLLEKKFQKEAISYQKVENAFTYISDYARAQKLSDSLRIDDIKQTLDVLLTRYCPLPPEWNVSFFYTISQCEYSMDVVFKEQDTLKPLYDNIVKTAMHTVTPENIATFLGKRLTVKFEGEMGSRYNERVLGTRIKHQMDALSVKIYDKFGKILRIEVTAYDVSQINLFRDVFKRNGNIESKCAPAKKDIFSLFPLISTFKNIINRYLEFISSFDDPSSGIKKLDNITATKTVDGKNFKGVNFFDKTDEAILLSIADPKFSLNGFTCKNLKSSFPQFKPWKLSAILKRLRILGLIKKVSSSYKYYLTDLGKRASIAGLYLKNTLLVSALATS